MEANSTLLHYGNDTSHIHTHTHTHTPTTCSIVDILHSGSLGLSQCSLTITFLWIFVCYFLLMFMRVSINVHFSFTDWNCFQNFFYVIWQTLTSRKYAVHLEESKKVNGRKWTPIRQKQILTISCLNLSQLPLSFFFSSQN